MNIKHFLIPNVLLGTLLLSACGNDHTNNAPVATNSTLITQADTPVSGQLMGSDVDGNKLSYGIVTQPTQGTIVLQSNGSFVYTPAVDTTGTDTFTFVASDGNLASPTATVNITINQLDVAFDSYSRKAFAQAATANPLSVNTRNIEQNVTDPAAYNDLLQ